MTYSVKAGQRIQADGPEDMSLAQSQDGVRSFPDKSSETKQTKKLQSIDKGIHSGNESKGKQVE